MHSYIPWDVLMCEDFVNFVRRAVQVGNRTVTCIKILIMFSNFHNQKHVFGRALVFRPLVHLYRAI